MNQQTSIYIDSSVPDLCLLQNVTVVGKNPNIQLFANVQNVHSMDLRWEPTKIVSFIQSIFTEGLPSIPALKEHWHS